MFKSEPICILKAGPTIDGRNIPQKVIDDIAETYDPKHYTARINDDHCVWSAKGGSVLSVEKRGDELWAEIKPNSHLLRNIENGQLLHTSCEYIENFAESGKAYLTGLAFTDEPASLGTTQVHLSANGKKNEKAERACTGQMINGKNQLSNKAPSNEERSLIKKFFNLLNIDLDEDEEQQIKPEESDDMPEIKELLEQSVELLQKLDKQVEALIDMHGKEQDPEKEPEPEPDGENPLDKKVDELSSKLDKLVTKLGSMTDEGRRKLAGQDDDGGVYL